MSSHVITPGPYRATKLWNEVTQLFRAGMPLKKHRHNFRHHASCFTASAAVDWLHQLLLSNSNFGPDVSRQQTVQLLKKFLKNHVIEDVKGRWGTEDLEDNNVLYRFPSTSPLKAIPCPASPSLKKTFSLRDKEGFFRFRTIKKHEKEPQENDDPALQAQNKDQPIGEQQTQKRQLRVEDEQEVWKDITLTHLQKILGLASLDEVLDPHYVNPQNIIHNMTRVNKHGVVTLDDKTNDLPHWVLSAMKSLANWPKYDAAQQSYPGFERDVFKTVSDYFYSLPQPLLTYKLYELFINVLVLCGYVAAPTMHQSVKRKKPDIPSVLPPAKASFHSTECLLLSLLRQGSCDETESPMTKVIGGELKGGPAGAGVVEPKRPRVRSCSLETILGDPEPLAHQQLFLSTDSLASYVCSRSCQDSFAPKDINSGDNSPVDAPSFPKAPDLPVNSAPEGLRKNRQSVVSMTTQQPHALRPRSIGSCLDIVMENCGEDVNDAQWQSQATSCLNVNSDADQFHSSSCSRPRFSSTPLSNPTKMPNFNAAAGQFGPRSASSTSSLWTVPAPAFAHRCLSSLDVSKLIQPASVLKPAVCASTGNFRLPPPIPQNSLLQPRCERVAIEALQLCTLLLPPASRRKLQLLMRMMSRISQNVDMPRLHPAVGTRTMMVHTFSGCVLASAEEGDLDELLATRLVSFLMDHQHIILSVPEYLLSAVCDHLHYLRTVQIPITADSGIKDGEPVCDPVPLHMFCHQISSAEFEQQKLASSQKAMEELLELLLADQNMTEKDKRKKLKQFQKQYPDIYRRRFPSSGGPNQTDKPKIKPPLINFKRAKSFSLRN
ncbi:DEP domain-containing protein 1A [Thalassophryne amazonica]|uniref:DEP domain-containing protein 1A n=1 Tax=Thalassophryne amazonica TaxID=390379 RepID=UPI001470D16B|nr:DEP domain-containing protein 1A [Thalassophryne amazonica]